MLSTTTIWFSKQVKVGAVVSTTVMVEVQLSVYSPSSMVNTTDVVPSGYGPCGDTVRVNGVLSGSKDPLSKS